jgi:hypothetical protein
MYIRKIAAAAGFACGAALAFAPLAAAVPDPTLVTDTLDSEIAAQNSAFQLDALLAGDYNDITVATTPGVYDSIIPSDLSTVAPQATSYGQVTPLETELYGANPILAGISADSGPYNEFNGALTEFYDAYNVAVYAAANSGALDTNAGDYLGSASNIDHALATGSVSGAEQYFYNFGLGDLKGYDAIFAPSATSVGDINPTIGNEIVQLNNLFELDGKLTDVYGDIMPHASTAYGVGFDTIPTSDLNTSFNDLVTGLNPANVSGDPGSYDVLNGALTEYYNAFNVEDYSLLNNGSLLPPADIFGTHAEATTVAASVAEYLNLGYQDLLGYFEPAASTAASLF